MKAERAVILLGLLIIVMASLPIWKAFVLVEGILAADALLLAVFFWFFFKRTRKAFKRDFKRYLLFFSLWAVIVQFAVFSMLFLDPLETGVGLFVAVVLALVLLSVFFRLVLGKSEVIGKVLVSDSENAVVELEFNLFAGINSGKYAVSTQKKHRKGEKVRVAVKKKLFRKVPDRIAGRAK